MTSVRYARGPRSSYDSAGLIVISVMLALLAGEAVVRLFAPQPSRLESPGLFVADSKLGYRLSQSYDGFRGNRIEYMNRVRTDALGLRTAHDSGGASDIGGRGSGSDDGGRPILVLGDSFIFGQGVEAENAFSSRLEQRLRGTRNSAKVLNGGVPGYGLRQEATWLSLYGPGIRPQLVVIGIYLGNDLADGLKSAARILIDGTVTAGPRTWHTPVTSWLYLHSQLYLLAREQGKRVAALLVPKRRGQSDFTSPFEATDSAVRKAEIDSAAAAMDDLLREAASRQSAVFAILIPQVVQVERRRLGDLPRRLRQPGAMDLTYPNRIFARLLSDRGVPYLDLTTAFREAAEKGDTLYYRVDRHWNVKGHDLAAALVAKAIQSGLRRPADKAVTRTSDSSR